MKVFMASLILGALLGIIPSPLPGQQNQPPQHSAQEIEVLKKRVSALEKQLQTVENVEKMELVKNYTDALAKLTDANAKLDNARFSTFERRLIDSNKKWLTFWGLGFLTILSVIGGFSLHWLKSKTNKFMVDEVEKNLKGFKKSLNQVYILKTEVATLKNEQLLLAREHVALVLNDFAHHLLQNENLHPESIKVLREEILLAVLGDDQASVMLRCKTAVVLAARKSSRLVPPLLEFLNGVVDSDVEITYETEQNLRICVNIFANIHTLETYQGLSKFLNRLLTENPQRRELFLTWSAFALADVGVQLNMTNSANILKSAITHLNLRGEREGPIVLATFFDKANAPEDLREILIIHGESLASDVVDKYLKLLQKHDPEFVENWRAQNATDNAESS